MTPRDTQTAEPPTPAGAVTPADASSTGRTTARLLGGAVLAGALVGPVDLALQVLLPYPWANLANSSAVWALLAFAWAAWARTSVPVAVVGSSLLLVVAVETYYVAAWAVDMAGLGSLVAPTTVAWALSGVVAGVVFGTAGTWWSRVDRAPGRAAFALAATAAVFFAEASLRHLPGSGSGLTDLGTALITAGLGVAVLLLAVRRGPVLLRAVLLAVPLTAAGLVAFRLAGY